MTCGFSLVQGFSMELLCGIKGLPDDFLEYLDIDILEIVDIETSDARLVLSEFFENGGRSINSGENVEG